MKTIHIILICSGFMLLGLILVISANYYSIQIIQGKIEELKPKEIKTISDYENVIEESKRKIDEITKHKWLKVSDIKEHLTLSYNKTMYYLDTSDWLNLLKNAEDFPLLFSTSSEQPLLDVRIGVTTEQIVKALKSIDPNEFIRPKKEEIKTNASWQIDFQGK